MNFLIDESLSLKVAHLLAEAGHDAVHVTDLNLLGAPDADVMEAARASERIIVSVDTDFGELLAIGQHPGPSVILLRRSPHRPDGQVRRILASLDDATESLLAGAVVTLSPGTARIRLLPITPSD